MVLSWIKKEERVVRIATIVKGKHSLINKETTTVSVPVVTCALYVLPLSSPRSLLLQEKEEEK